MRRIGQGLYEGGYAEVQKEYFGCWEVSRDGEARVDKDRLVVGRRGWEFVLSVYIFRICGGSKINGRFFELYVWVKE